jgi:hypothetical protein
MAEGHRGLFNKISDNTIFIDLNDSASSRVRHLVNSYRGNLGAESMKFQHAIHVSYRHKKTKRMPLLLPVSETRNKREKNVLRQKNKIAKSGP